MNATEWLGVATVSVAVVQAIIYFQQRTAQMQANKQSLFDRRYQIYKQVKFHVSHYVKVNGRYIKGDLAEAMDDAVDQAKFVFPQKAYHQFYLTVHLLKKHITALPQPVIDPVKSTTTWNDTEQSVEIMGQLKRQFDDLDVHLDSMRLAERSLWQVLTRK